MSVTLLYNLMTYYVNFLKEFLYSIQYKIPSNSVPRTPLNR